MHGEAPPPFDGEEAGLTTKTTIDTYESWAIPGQSVAVLHIPVMSHIIVFSVVWCRGRRKRGRSGSVHGRQVRTWRGWTRKTTPMRNQSRGNEDSPGKMTITRPFYLP